MTGTVFDIGYQRYSGTREGIRRSRLAIFKDSLRITLGLGRGGRAKILPWFFLVVLTFIALMMALIAGAAERMGGPGASDNLPKHLDYYGIASIILFVFAAVVGPELLCRDRREGVINLYLVRPVTGTDYIAARWLAFVTVLTIGACWLPQIILLLGLAAGDADPAQYMRTHWLDVPKFLLAGVVMAVYAATVALLTASFTTRRAYASVFLVGLFIISTPFTAGMASEMGDSVAGRWISLFNLTNIPVHVNDVIFGQVSELTEEAPAAQLSAAVKVAWYLLWTAGPAALLWWRYRRISA